MQIESYKDWSNIPTDITNTNAHMLTCQFEHDNSVRLNLALIASAFHSAAPLFTWVDTRRLVSFTQGYTHTHTRMCTVRLNLSVWTFCLKPIPNRESDPLRESQRGWCSVQLLPQLLHPVKLLVDRWLVPVQQCVSSAALLTNALVQEKAAGWQVGFFFLVGSIEFL